MHSIVIPFILGATFILQVEACHLQDAYSISKKKKNEVDDEMRDLSNFISRLHFNFIQELIEIKFHATFDDMESLVSTFVDSDEEVVPDVNDEGRSARDCLTPIFVDMAFFNRNISMEYQKCVLNQFQLLNLVENDIHDYLNELARCPLNMDPLAVSICLYSNYRNRTSCIEVNANSNYAEAMPYECSLDQFNPRKERLQDDALRLASVGKLNAIRCISESKKKLNAELETAVENIEKCEAQGE